MQVIANPIAAMLSGQQAADQSRQLNRNRALDQLYSTQGAGIANGDPQAVNALAALDPQAAMQIKQQQFQNEQTLAAGSRSERGLDMQEQSFAMRKREFELQIQKHAASLSAAEREAELANIEQGVKEAVASETAEQWDATVTRLGQPELVGQFENRKAILSQYVSAAEIYKSLQAQEPADEYGRYVAETQAKGEAPLDRIQFAQAKKGKGFSVTTADGTTVQYGGPASDNKVSPSSPEAMVSSIDGILGDPALDFATGWMAWMQKLPGTEAKRFGARAKQLEGQAFLQAFESLKGGGQITEIEGQKATQAIGRLDTAQHPDDYRDALNELRDVLVLGASRPEGWASRDVGGGASNGAIPPAFSESVPQGEDPQALWEFMTPEQKALFE